MILAGCVGEASDRRGIEGAVTLDGAPIPSGSIAFRPIESTDSPSAGAEIVDGDFTVPADKGVRPGRFRVEILATRKTGKTIEDPVFGPTEGDEQYLPPRFNTRSELTADVTESGMNQLRFDLKSKK